MDGEDVFGRRIRVQLATDAASSPCPPPPTSSGAGCGGGGSPTGRAMNCRAGLDQPCSASRDSGVDDVPRQDHGRAPVDELPPRRRRPCDDEPAPDSEAPTNGDDIVVCGPVEEIDVDVETPTKDVGTCAAGARAPEPRPSAKKTKETKKAKPSKSQCPAKPCKHVVPYCSLESVCCELLADFLEIALVSFTPC